MEKERWKVRICVLTAIFLAVVVGVIYYVQCVKTTEITEGVLISIMEAYGAE